MTASAVETPESTKKSSRKKMPGPTLVEQKSSLVSLEFTEARSQAKALSIKRVYRPDGDATDQAEVNLTLDVHPDTGDNYPALKAIGELMAESAAIVEGKSQMKLSLKRDYQASHWRLVDLITAMDLEVYGEVKGAPVAIVVDGELRLRLNLKLTVPADQLGNLGRLLGAPDFKVSTVALQTSLV